MRKVALWYLGKKAESMDEMEYQARLKFGRVPR